MINQIPRKATPSQPLLQKLKVVINQHKTTIKEEGSRKLTDSACEGGSPVSQNHIKFGGVGFNAKVSPSKINRFVHNLPDTKRQSLFQVAEELKSAEMIEITEDITHQHNKNLYNTESH